MTATNFKKYKKINKNIIINAIVFAIIISIITYFLKKNLASSIIAFFVVILFISAYFFIRKNLKKSADLKKMEEVFPDFIELMSSNLRAGMTIDQALLLSSRKEFSPLDSEITRVGKDITTGKDIKIALQEMGKRINSEKIKKTINLIISGIKSGGNLSVLLEQTAVSMRERNFVEKRAASNVLMYVIFIFFATAIGSPVLFALSSVLVEVLTSIVSTIPNTETTIALPLTLRNISISITFIKYFSLAFLIVTNILASMIIGLVNKGEEKAGLSYILPLIIISTTIFFVIRSVFSTYFSGLFG